MALSGVYIPPKVEDTAGLKRKIKQQRRALRGLNKALNRNLKWSSKITDFYIREVCRHGETKKELANARSTFSFGSVVITIIFWLAPAFLTYLVMK